MLQQIKPAPKHRHSKTRDPKDDERYRLALEGLLNEGKKIFEDFDPNATANETRRQKRLRRHHHRINATTKTAPTKQGHRRSSTPTKQVHRRSSTPTPRKHDEHDGHDEHDEHDGHDEHDE